MKVSASSPAVSPSQGVDGASLAQVSFQQEGTDPRVVHFRASAPGANFGVKGREDALVGVYLNGKYFSTEAILSERGGPGGVGDYSVNLGALPKGHYTVELRAQTRLSPSAPSARIEPGSVQVERYADALRRELASFEPLFVTRARDTSLFPVGSSDSSDPRPTIARTDVPVELRGRVVGDPSGVHLLRYEVTFTDEDGGTPDAKRGRIYHRTTDDEWLYAVLVGKDGQALTPEQLSALKARRGQGVDPEVERYIQSMKTPESFQYGKDSGVQTHHQPRDFHGLKVDGRPVLRDNSLNNNFAEVRSLAQVKDPVWSPEVNFAEDRTQKDAQGRIYERGGQSAVDVVAANPWMAQASREEIAREPKDTSFVRRLNGALDTVRVQLARGWAKVDPDSSGS